MMSNQSEEWRSNADTHKMSPEQVNKYGLESSKRPPGEHPGNVLHQRRNLPFSKPVMAVAGFVIVGVIGYFTLLYKSKPGTTAEDVAKATVSNEGGGHIKK